MSDVKIKVRASGPLLVEGKFELLDSEGNPYPLDENKTNFAFCRCGQSERMPFCDGTHNRCEFDSVVLAPSESD